MANPSIRISEFEQTAQVMDRDSLVAALSGKNVRTTPIQIYEYFKNRLLTDPDFISKFLNLAYPIGSVYMTTASSNPLEQYKFMTWKWVEISRGRCLEGAPDPKNVGATLEAGMPPAPDDITINADTFRHTHEINDPGHAHRYCGTRTAACHQSTHEHNVLRGSVYSTGDAHTGIKLGAPEYRNKNFQIEIKPGSSNIYGKSNTVQPKAMLAKIYKRIS